MTLRPILNDLTAHGLGWIGVVKIAGAWVPTRRLGKVMAVLSLSFLIGDAAVRATLAGLLRRQYGRRSHGPRSHYPARPWIFPYWFCIENKQGCAMMTLRPTASSRGR